MDHKTRLHIAHELKKKILKKHTDAILGIAIYGSVAKNEDRKYSDLEMFVITRRKLKKREIRYVYGDMAVEVSYIFSRDMLRNARQVTPNWAIEADFYRNYLILYEKNKWFTKLKRAVEAQDTRAFKKAMTPVRGGGRNLIVAIDVVTSRRAAAEHFAERRVWARKREFHGPRPVRVHVARIEDVKPTATA